MENHLEPIVAIATAPGQGGVGVVRVSFGRVNEPAVQAFIQALCRKALVARHATHTAFFDEQGEKLDEGIGLYFAGPYSYTGESVLELQGHGGPVVLQLLLNRCLEAGRAVGIGIRLAEPGEFTRRAFLNDKLDLAQAEAVADLIAASTEAAVRSAGRSLSGVFSKAVNALVKQLIHLRMLIEATLDFPEEEVDFLEAADAKGQLKRIDQALCDIRAQAQQGALLRSGLSVVLAGSPNVGKSSLLNALAGAELAIVTPFAGTTRDKITQTIQIEGIPLHLVDTAGLRESDDPIERIGMERTWEAIQKADVVLHMFDVRDRDQVWAAQCENAGGLPNVENTIKNTTKNTASHDVHAASFVQQIALQFPPHLPVVQVFNKIDLLDAAQRQRLQESQALGSAGTGIEDAAESSKTDSSLKGVYLCAQTGEGIGQLRAQLLALAGWQSGETTFLARARHLEALEAAQEHIACAIEHAKVRACSLDLLAEELRLAQEQLNTITGAFTSDDLLGEIFSQFCIGK